jgi:hypothetical protein
MDNKVFGIVSGPSTLSESSKSLAKTVRIAVLIPDRGDRNHFTENCISLIENQTLKPASVLKVGHAPKSDRADITERYRIGYGMLSKLSGIDLIAFIENDDYYAPEYLETMAAHWIESGKPQLLGTCYSWYYHIGLLKYTKLEHYTRSAAMNTFIVPGLEFTWCADTEPYTDMHLWSNCPNLIKKIVNPERIISLGIKHGVGKCGGGSHIDRLNKYKHDDSLMEWLFSNVSESFHNFYIRLHAEIRSKY